MFRTALKGAALFYIADRGCIAVSMFGHLCLTQAKQNAILLVFELREFLGGKVREVH